jgi:hypothetical protein
MKDILGIIGRIEWTYAKTMPSNPHEYIVQGKVNDADFTALFKAIQQNGIVESWYGVKRMYLYMPDGRKYWCIDKIINRCWSDDPRNYSDERRNGLA